MITDGPFDGSDAVIYSQRTNFGTISGAINITGGGGLSKIGAGAITLNSGKTQP